MNRKITPEQREEMVRLHKKGVSVYRIAQIYGVSKSCATYNVHPFYKKVLYKYAAVHKETLRLYKQMYTAKRRKVRETKERYYQKNKEKQKEAFKAWYAIPANRAKVIARVAINNDRLRRERKAKKAEKVALLFKRAKELHLI